MKMPMRDAIQQKDVELVSTSNVSLNTFDHSMIIDKMKNIALGILFG